MRKEYQYYGRYCGYNQRLYILLNNQHRTGTNQVEWIHAVALEDHEPFSSGPKIHEVREGIGSCRGWKTLRDLGQQQYTNQCPPCGIPAENRPACKDRQLRPDPSMHKASCLALPCLVW